MGLRRSLSVGSSLLEGRYTILKLISGKGMANVYLAKDTSIQKIWCIKEIHKPVQGSSEKDILEYKSLLHEVSLMAKLNHSGIPRVVTQAQDSTNHYFVMDYIEGLSVKEIIDRGKQIPVKQAVSWMIQITLILGYLHSIKNPIVYRDIKPDNIMVQPNGSVVLLDFGISEEVSEDNRKVIKPLGTKGYAAPEQAVVGSELDPLMDIYGVGASIFHMLTGVLPEVWKRERANDYVKSLKGLSGEDIKKEYRKYKDLVNLNVRSLDTSINSGLAEIIIRCTERDPKDRYQSIEEVTYNLKNYELLDVGFRKKAKRKFIISSSLMVGGVIILLGSIIPYAIGGYQDAKDYESAVAVAKQTGRLKDYLNAVQKKPTVIEPYFGLIDSIKQDGVFSPEEEKSILDLINPNIETLKKSDKYGDIAYNVGVLYWYYWGDDSGQPLSVQWFEDAANNASKDSKIARVYADLAKFHKDIKLSIQESNDKGKYTKYWKGINEAESISSGEIMEIQVYRGYIDAVINYSYRLRKDGIKQEEVKSKIDKVSQYLNKITPSPGRPEDIFKELKKKLPEAVEKLNIAYSLKES